MRESVRFSCLAVFATFCLFDLTLSAQAPLNLRRVQPTDRITKPINDALRVTRSGNRHPLARPEFDAGLAEPDTRLDRMVLLLQPDAGQQQALDTLTAAQQDAQSPLYHQWLTAEEYGRQFGVSGHDLNQVVSWLETNGFEVEPVAEDRRALIFSGTAGQVAAAFGAEIHRYRINGELHHANATDPQIPRALSTVVSGVVSLHDFDAKPMHVAALAETAPEYTSGSSHYLAPADFATIYNLNSLYGSSTDGTGQSIAIVGRSNINLTDVQAFRSRMGLPANDPTIVLNGTDPGVVTGGEQMEAQLDVEWSGAVAKNATVQMVVSKSTTTTDGVLLSAQYIVNHNLAPVVSVSFGLCESAMGTTYTQFWNSLWQQAAAQGISAFVSSGDSGAAGCASSSATTATGGRAVNGLCTSPYSTCVGGTEFADTTNPALYWSTTNNTATSGSALSYIPEKAWSGSGGGASIMFSKPSWQTGAGVPADGARDVPDVSLSSSTHDSYLVGNNGQYYAVAGTSAAAPSFAGLLALVTQRQAGRQGNVNPILYTLASRQAAGGAAVFHDVTSGDNTFGGLTGFHAVAGYDQATGLGSVDANQLVNAWGSGSTPIPSFQLSASRATAAVTQGANTTATLTTTVSGGFTSAVTLSAGTLPSGLTAALAPASIASPGSGSSTLTLTAAAQLATGTYNLTLTASGGGITAAAPLALTVASSCTYALSPAAASKPATAGTDSVTLMAATGCSWTAASSASWITVTAGASGTGNGKISYSVADNTSTSSRTGTITIAGLAFSITQAGAAPATFSLSPTMVGMAAAGGSGTVSITAPSTTSSWTAKSNVSWITLTGAASGAGSKIITYAVAANTATTARTGTLTIAGLTVTVTQAAGVCSYRINPGPLTSSSGGVTGTIAVTAPAGCNWTSTSNVSWIIIRSGASGSGNGAVTFFLAANTTGRARAGTLTVAGYTITVTFGPAPHLQVEEPISMSALR